MPDLFDIQGAIAQINAQTIPELEGVIQRQLATVPKILADAIDRAMAEEGNLLSGFVRDLNNMLDRIDAMSKRYEALAARLDGATFRLGPEKP